MISKRIPTAKNIPAMLIADKLKKAKNACHSLTRVFSCLLTETNKRSVTHVPDDYRRAVGSFFNRLETRRTTLFFGGANDKSSHKAKVHCQNCLLFLLAKVANGDSPARALL